MDRLSKDVVHEICTNQVVVTLQACIKELVENSLDAGASRIEIRLRESGSELLEVVDDGRGIAQQDHEKVATRHATSKIRVYEDLNQTLSTFGFRGEALSAIAAMGDMTVSTRTASDKMASLLSYDRFGRLSTSVPAAREVGTTVSVRELFKRLPVRHKEFLRNAKAQVAATLRLIQAYAIAQPEVRFHVVNEKVKGQTPGRSTLLTTSGSSKGITQAAAAVLGDAAVADTRTLELKSSATGWFVSGIISSPSGGRRSRDTQMFFVNQRPIDPPKRISKLINDTFHQYNSRAYPLLILSFNAPQGMVDVNVTPDKKTVFLHNEEALLADLQQALTELYTSNPTAGVGLPLSSFGIRTTSPALQDLGPEICVPTRNCFRNSQTESLVSSEESPLSSPQTNSRSGNLISDALVPEIQTPQADRQTCEDSTPEKPIFEIQPVESDINLSASWPRPLKRRHSELSHGEHDDIEFEVIEMEGPTMEVSAGPCEEGSDRTVSILQQEDLVIPQGLSLSEDMIIEEYVPVFQASSSEDCQALVAAEESQSQDTAESKGHSSLPAIGVSTQASVGLAALSASLEAKRHRRDTALCAASAQGDNFDSEVSFPSAFSLSTLRDDSAGGPSLEEVAKFATSSSSFDTNLRFSKKSFLDMRVIGQFNLGFIIASLKTGQHQSKQDTARSSRADGTQLFIIDQHASDEKFRFEALNRESRIDRQPLVSPYRLQLTPAQEQLAEANIEVFRLNGFEMQKDESNPPGKRLRVSTLPSCQGMVFTEKDIQDLLFTLEENETVPSKDITKSSSGLLDLDGHRALWSATALPRPKKVWALLACKACRGATMIGKALRTSEMERILTNLSILQQPWNCPHGRPTMRHLADAGAAQELLRKVPPLSNFRV